MNWGHKILITYGVFVAGIAYLVVRSVNEKVDLVTPEYYAEELKFQDKIDEQKNAATLSSAVSVDFKDHALTLSFPAEFKGKEVKGKLLVYYPADKNKDLNMDFSTSDAVYHAPLPENIHGGYELHINWTVDKVNYYTEQKIFF